MEYGLIGEHLSHSHSPAIHKMLGSTPYELMPIPPEELDDFMHKAPFRAINVTIPYKRRVVPFCDTLDEVARSTGSVNTIVKDKEGRLHGFNTDTAGFLFMAKRAGISFAGEKVLIFGTGGTGHTAQCAVTGQNAASVISVSRNGPDNYKNLVRHRDAAILVNTTPVGMYPNNGEELVDLTQFPVCRGVVDVIYNPLSTKLILDAKERGIAATGGLPMLVAQAAYAAGLFLNREFSDEAIEQTVQKMIRKLSNLVLIGMPGSGKTTLSRMAATKLGREVVDIDDAIEKKAGMTIPEIFTLRGESVFRTLEAETIKEISAKTGLVISVGGGAPMNPLNSAALKQNGFLIYIRRDIEALATEGRPLSTDRQTLVEMLRIREPVYLNNADAIANNNKPPQRVLQDILKTFGGAV